MKIPAKSDGRWKFAEDSNNLDSIVRGPKLEDMATGLPDINIGPTVNQFPAVQIAR
jgi:hypothetical protein